MKKWLPILLVLVFAAWAGRGFFPKQKSEYDLRAFGELPVLANGRIQPWDSVARNTLRQLRGKQTAPEKLHFSVFNPARRGKTMPATQWLLELLSDPATADTRKVFRVDHPDVIALLKLPDKDVEAGEDGKHFSYAQIEPRLDDLTREGRRVQEMESATRNTAEQATYKLFGAINLYQRLKVSVCPPGVKNLDEHLTTFEASLKDGVAAVRARESGEEYDTRTFDDFIARVAEYDRVARFGYLRCVPPAAANANPDDWENFGAAVLGAIHSEGLPDNAQDYAAIIGARQAGNVERFNTAVRELSGRLNQAQPAAMSKARQEYLFSASQLFYHATAIYVLALLLVLAFWFKPLVTLRLSASGLIWLAWAMHTVGLVWRMGLEGRPPVTNLYSSAVFIGWAAVLLGLILEKFNKDGVGLMVAAIVGFTTQIIAHNLALGGDTMEMMRAVLDTNFWLATHVVTITLGYSAMFIAGALAIIYIVRGVFTSSLNKATADAMGKMVYGIICFATLFSFVGTVLGGIWADQSWGRFWGWDPKENGALLIVLWCAVVLHSRWGGLVKARGLMNMALVGNIITSFSWFGVNMLGIGLHSYGFMDSAFRWLVLFMATQLALIGLGLLPLSMWRSFGDGGSSTGRSGSQPVPTMG
jgi:ABC-type transport system involved in cytochrome c biogenesis permease subunit